MRNGRSRLAALVVGGMAAGAFLVWAIPGLAVSGESQVAGTVSKWVAKNSNDDQCTTSSEWTTVSDTTVTFNTTAFHQRVLIMFQGSWERTGESSSPNADLRAVIDGNVVNIDGIGDVETVDIDEADDTHGFNWISEELHPGGHTAWIEFQETGSSDSACVDERSMIVLAP